MIIEYTLHNPALTFDNIHTFKMGFKKKNESDGAVSKPMANSSSTMNRKERLEKLRKLRQRKVSK